MRIRGILRLLSGCALVAFALVSSSRAEDLDAKKAFATARKTFQQGMRSKQADTRVAAIRKLGESPTTDAAALLLKIGMKDTAEEVRKATRETLIGYRDQQEIGMYLVEQLNLPTRKDSMAEAAYNILGVVCLFEDAEVQQAVTKFLDDTLGTPKGNLLLIFTLMDDLGKQGDAEALQALKTLAKARFFEVNFGYRRCLLQNVMKSRVAESVTYLLELLPKLKGLVQHDVVEYLTNITGQNFRDDYVKWRAWWEGQKPTFKIPPLGTVLAEFKVDEKSPRYYGIPICAKRVLFVLDTSGSMRGAPLEAAQRALIEVIKQLPESVHFNILMFDNTIRPWQSTMVQATEDKKHQAVRTVLSQDVGRRTNSFGALDASFTFDPEAIYFLSDGAPTDGHPLEIVNAIRQKNFTRRISIHTIGIGTADPNVQVFADFMKTLAEVDYGQYKTVDR